MKTAIYIEDGTVQLAESGEICGVMGHSWGEASHYYLQNHLDGITAHRQYDPDGWYRKCHICRKPQSKKMGNWK